MDPLKLLKPMPTNSNTDTRDLEAIVAQHTDLEARLRHTAAQYDEIDRGDLAALQREAADALAAQRAEIERLNDVLRSTKRERDDASESLQLSVRDYKEAVHWKHDFVDACRQRDSLEAQLAEARAEIERLHAEQTRLRSVIEVLTDGGDVRVATDLWQRAKDAEAQLAEAQRALEVCRDRLVGPGGAVAAIDAALKGEKP